MSLKDLPRNPMCSFCVYHSYTKVDGIKHYYCWYPYGIKYQELEYITRCETMETKDMEIVPVMKCDNFSPAPWNI